MEKVIITAALTGSRTTREANPAVPYTPQEIAAAAVECCRAGAAIVHVHVRDPETGASSMKLELFREVLDHIRQACDILVNLTTSGLFLGGPDMIDDRLGPVTLRPDLCSLDIGSVNFRERAFVNPPAWGEAAAQRMREYGVKPEIEVFDVGHIYQALDYIQQGRFDPPPYFQLCMGARWGMAATPENLLFMRSKLPADARWSVLGVGPGQLPMITMGILLGNVYIRRGVLARSNAESVEMAASLVGQLQRDVATPSEARAILGVQGS
jgi:3-keto-5-aminohexanoate cleavage enzyme